MGTSKAVVRAVLDTNVLVSALLFRGETSRLRDHWRSRRLVLIVSRDTLGELVRVLAYPKFNLTTETLNALLGAEVLPFVELVHVTSGTPQCRDPDDDMFLWCAAESRAGAVVSGDPDLLGLRPTIAGVVILTVREALERLDDPTSPPG